MSTFAEEAAAQYIDGVPGSLHLTDTSVAHGVEAGANHSKDDVILQPQPTRDVNDPYNWSTWRKHKTLFATAFYVFTCGFCCSTVYSGYAQIEAEKGISYSTLTQGTGYLYGFYGWAGPFLIPLALKYGHRPLYFLSLFPMFAMTIWVPWIKTDGQWIASRIIYGTFGTACESMNEVSIAMIYFAHERGYYIGIWTIALYFGAFLAPICSGYIFEAGGLDAVMYFTSGMLALGIAVIFFCFEEVNYNRHPAHHDADAKVTRSSTPEKGDPTFAGVGAAHDEIRLGQDRHLVGTPHSYWYTLGMFRETYCTNQQMLAAMWRPWYLMFRFPCVFYAGFSLGLSLCIYTIMTGTIGTVLNAAPYNFSSGATGLVYIGPLIMACVSGPLTGLAGDWLVLRSARRNGGVREPEARLWVNVFCAVIIPPAFILWGVGAVHGVHWFGLEMALIWIGSYVVVQAGVSCAYILDCYKELALEVMIAAVIIRNSMSFAIGYAVAPWLAGMGIQNTYLTMGFAGCAFVLSFLIIVWKGKNWRAESKEIYWNFVATSASAH